MRALHHDQGGSAYLTALLAAAFLSVAGLSVTALTHTSVKIGAYERLSTQVLYAADAGLNEATARTLSLYDYRPKALIFDEPNGTLDVDLKSEVDVGWVLPVLDAPCNLCQINQGSNFSKINHLVTVTARRTAAGLDVAERTVAATVELQPRQASIPPMDIPADELAKIRF